jgi:hypothetical protein
MEVDDVASLVDSSETDEDAIYSLEFKDKRLFICKIYIFNSIS